MSQEAGPGTVIELTITALSHAGEGIGRHAGRAIFVPYALPGEVVRAQIAEEKKNFARAELVEVLTPAPDRILPRCPHHFSPQSPFGASRLASACGGCQLQHMSYAAQLDFKRRTVVEQLTRIGGLSDPPVRPARPAPAPFYYRNHVQFSLTAQGELAFNAAGLRRAVPITECHLLPPALAELHQHIRIESVPEVERLSLRADAHGNDLVIFESESDAPEVELEAPVSAALLRPDGSSLILAGSDSVEQIVQDRSFRVSAGSFFQVNTPMAEVLVDLVMEGLALAGGEAVLDLYCGVGLFTRFIAPVAGRVIGVEAFSPAVNDAVRNLDAFDNVEIYEAPAEDVLPGLGVPFDAIVLDPPRAGCSPSVLDALGRFGAARIVYVSCDPATLARDAKRLTAAGYQLEWAEPLDMFPQTYHVECVAVFALSKT